jgi:hypothetical protein
MSVRAWCVAGPAIAGCILGLAPRAFAQEPATAPTKVHFEAAAADADFHVRLDDARGACRLAG